MSVEIPRYSLPIADVRRPGLTTYDAQDPETEYPAIRPLRPPAGAPNVLLILLDDVGFGASSAFGGPVAMPVAERLAAGGLKYTRFHTTALCSPSRAALLSGRNHHAVGMGAITEIATAAPGYSSMRPNTITPLAEILRLNGYATGQFGKCHEVPAWETSPAGPFDRWPTGSGFEHFFGFIAGETNQWYPALARGRDAGRAVGHPGGGLSPDARPRGQDDRVGPSAEGVDARSAVLRVLRAGRDPRTAPRARRSGPTSTRAPSMRAGTRCASRRSRVRSSWA